MLEVMGTKSEFIESTAGQALITECVTVCRNPKEEKFFGLVLNGQADLIISGDAELLVHDQFKKFPIIGPATFGRSQLL
jgi:uncharacterized protein